jgi:hypothetical protein
MEIQVVKERFDGTALEGDKQQKPTLVRFNAWIYFLSA